MKKSIKLLTAGLLLTLCAGLASCGGGSSSSSSSSSSTSSSSSSSYVWHFTLESPKIIDFYSNVTTVTHLDGRVVDYYDYTLDWEFIWNAQGYTVTIDGVPYETDDTWFNLYDYTEGGKEYDITVTAKGDGELYFDSEPTKTRVFRQHVSEGLTYDGDYALLKSDLGLEEIYVVERYDNKEIKNVFSDTKKDAQIKKVWIPKNVEVVCFSGLKELEEVVFEEGSKIKEFYSGAFYDTAIETFEIPASVERIGPNAFGGGNIKEITVEEGSRHFCSIDGNLYSKDQRKLIQYAGGKKDEEFIVPDSVMFYERESFSYCPNLKKIVFSNNPACEKLFNFPVWGCESLTEIILPQNVKTVGGVTRECPNVKVLTLPKGVEHINDKPHDFVVIPKSVKEISVYINYTAYYEGSQEEWNKIQFRDSFKIEGIVYFYSEDEPEGEGNFWHYNSEGEIEVWE